MNHLGYHARAALPATSWLLSVALGAAAGVLVYGILLWILRRRVLGLVAILKSLVAEGPGAAVGEECAGKSPEHRGAFGQVVGSVLGTRRFGLAVERLGETIRNERQEMIQREHDHLNWLSFLCHDLGAPLRRVLTRIEAIEFAGDTITAVERESTLESAHLEITQMSQLIASVNDYARFEYHSDRSFEAMPLDNLLKYAVAVFEFDASRKCIELDLRIVPGVGEVRINEYLVRRAVENLISNAIRFTPHGGLISVRAERSGSMVHIKVSDAGPGIEIEEFDKIFEVEYRGRMQLACAGGVESVGLGLALVRGVARMHGGEVSARNREQGGAEFVIALPVDAEPAE